VKGWNLPQAQAAARLGITQLRLNDLLRGRISKFSLDALVNLTARAARGSAGCAGGGTGGGLAS